MKSFRTGTNEEVLLDDADYQRLIVEAGYIYGVMRRGQKIIGIRRNISHRLTKTGKRGISLIHHDILGKPPEDMVTDHRDGNTLNNQRYNIWHCTVRQNGQNKRHSNNSRRYSSKYPGVDWHKQKGKWRVRVMVNGESVSLGFFKKEDELKAAQVYVDYVEKNCWQSWNNCK